MNSNSGNDPMLSSFAHDDWCKIKCTSSVATNSVPSLIPSTSAFMIPLECLLNPDPSLDLPEMAALWPSGRTLVSTVQEEEHSSYSASDSLDNGDVDMDDIDIESNTIVSDIKNEMDDTECKQRNMASTEKFQNEGFRLNESQARRYVEEQFEKIAFLPTSNMNQKEKIEFILSKSDCREFSAENILNFDKRNLESARACAKIVQNIPQRYRWECVTPEDIPSCYTIVADCKKVSCRDKPPRPMNAFMIWAQGARRLINELCPKMQNALISEALGFYWRQKSDSFKQTFEQEKLKLRRFHAVEFPEYKYRPKTKVQKAKEKQELSLTKARLRASVKRGKNQLGHEASPGRGYTAASRSGGSTSGSVSNETWSCDRTPEKSARKSATKPAIKDMLTLKILNDRRFREATHPEILSQEAVVSAFGQLSPLEVGCSGAGDIIDDICEPDTPEPSTVQPDDPCPKLNLTSVYDTPANTPPVDDNNDPHHSPVIPDPTSVSAPPISPTTFSTLKLSRNQTTTDLTPSPPQPLVTQLSSTRSSTELTSDHNISLIDLILRPTAAPINKEPSTEPCIFVKPTQLQAVPSSIHMKPLTRAPSHRDELSSHTPSAQSIDRDNHSPLTRLTDKAESKSVNESILTTPELFLNHATDTLLSHQQTADYENNLIDLNNNNSDINNNCYIDDNNNNLPSNYFTNLLTSKLGSSLVELGDLDTLLLDLDCQVLSDDDMRSILSSL